MSRIDRSTDIRAALRRRQGGFLMNPFRFAGGAPAGDPHYANVSLLLHMDGTNGSTTFTDSSPSPKTVTAYGNAQISTAQSKFGGASGRLDGSGDYWRIPTSSDFAFGTADFAIEFFLYRVGNGQQHLYEGRNGTTVNTILLYLNASSQLTYYANAGVRISTSVVPTLNTWVHIAASRYAGVTKLFYEGTQVGSSYADSINYAAPTTYLYIGTNDVASGSYVNAYFDEYRITKAVGRYPSDFAVPTAAFPDY